MEDRVLTLHPQGKRGVRIEKKKYEPVREAILSALTKKSLTHTQLVEAVEKKLQGKFEGSIGWYLESVKLDLEARKIIHRISSIKPAQYQLI